MNTNRFQLLALAAALLAPAALHAQFSQPMRDVENPAQNAFLLRGNFSTANSGDLTAVHEFGPVPAGKRLTIESLGLRCFTTGSTANAMYASVVLRMRGNTPIEGTVNATFPIQMVRQGLVGNNVAWVGTLTGRAFYDNPGGGPSARFEVSRSPTGSDLACAFTIVGGLTNLPLQ
jgi:hypothetical protein